ncbi:MAG: uridine monophosphate kinase [Planctomycetes bacterium]|nr:uridine monophosphate kinase [Planctomycetota bacterium]
MTARGEARTGVAARGRVLLKLTGEACGASGCGIESPRVAAMAREIAEGLASGPQLAIVPGAGNLVRGATLAAAGLERVRADQLGMIGTVANALAIEMALEAAGVRTCVFSAIEVRGIVPLSDPRAAVEALEGGRVVIFAGGLGQPFFTTDTTAAIRAVEIGAETLLKGTKVDGVYTDDPARDPSAVRFDRVGWDEVLRRELAVMDATAFQICRAHRLAIRVFDAMAPGGLARAIRGEPVGTLVAD